MLDAWAWFSTSLSPSLVSHRSVNAGPSWSPWSLLCSTFLVQGATTSHLDHRESLQTPATGQPTLHSAAKPDHMGANKARSTQLTGSHPARSPTPARQAPAVGHMNMRSSFPPQCLGTCCSLLLLCLAQPSLPLHPASLRTFSQAQRERPQFPQKVALSRILMDTAVNTFNWGAVILCSQPALPSCTFHKSRACFFGSENRNIAMMLRKQFPMTKRETEAITSDRVSGPHPPSLKTLSLVFQYHPPRSRQRSCTGPCSRPLTQSR